MFALPLIAGLAVPAMAEDMHRYITVFKYSDTAMKAMTENPQDRGAAAAKLAEAFGGKMEAAYWFSSGGDYDGMVVWLLPNDQAAEVLKRRLSKQRSWSESESPPLQIEAIPSEGSGLRDPFTQSYASWWGPVFGCAKRPGISFAKVSSNFS